MNKRKPLARRLLGTAFVLSLLTMSAFAADAEVPIDEKNFPNEAFREYVQAQFDKDGSSSLSDAEIAKATEIDLHYKNQIYSLSGIEHFSALEKLNINMVDVDELDLSKNTALKQLDCNKTRLTALDLTNNPNLESLDCSQSRLTQLDVSKNPALKKLDCSNNKLNTLNVGESTGLLQLECSNNQLTALDLSKNTALTELHCSDNQLTGLDLSNHTTLVNLTCHLNKLTELDVSKNAGLKELDLHMNEVSELNVSSNTALTMLDCSQNQLSKLDVSKNSALAKLLCSKNKLTALDLSKNSALEELFCSENQLSSLDLSSNTELKFASCSDNRYTVNQNEALDCSSLPGKFDASKTSNVVGGKFDVEHNTFSFDAGVTKATYDYATGNSERETVTFTLVYEAPVVPEPTEPKPTEPQPTEPKPTEPQPTEPKPTEPKPTEPKPTEPKPTEPSTPVIPPFTDVSTSDYYYEPVQWAVKKGITAGVAEGKFAPNQACTRGQIVTFLWAAQGKHEPTTTVNPFSDVDEGDYYYKAVLWAVENGITAGVSEGKFAPNQVCTRAQAVTFLWAAQGKPPVDTDISFGDVSASDYYANAVKWAAQNGVTAGVGGDRFAPSQNCSRGQIVTFLYKAEN